MSFYTEVIETDPRFNSTDSVRDLNLLEPVTRAAVQAILAEALSQHGIQLQVTETYRSQDRQQQLFAKGATKLQHVGVHHFGLACDFCRIVDGKADWTGDWSFLGELAKAHGMIWGGDWGQPDVEHSFRDSDHIQRCAEADQDNLFVRVWYPDESYNPYAS